MKPDGAADVDHRQHGLSSPVPTLASQGEASPRSGVTRPLDLPSHLLAGVSKVKSAPKSWRPIIVTQRPLGLAAYHPRQREPQETSRAEIISRQHVLGRPAVSSVRAGDTGLTPRHVPGTGLQSTPQVHGDTTVPSQFRSLVTRYPWLRSSSFTYAQDIDLAMDEASRTRPSTT